MANLPDSGSSFLPLECLYLNRSALVAMVGPQPPLSKHFTLKRKPKSAALRAELTQKGTFFIVDKYLNTGSVSVITGIILCSRDSRGCTVPQIIPNRK